MAYRLPGGENGYPEDLEGEWGFGIPVWARGVVLGLVGLVITETFYELTVRAAVVQCRLDHLSPQICRFVSSFWK